MSRIQGPENLANNIGLAFRKGSQPTGAYPGEKAEYTDSMPFFLSGDTRKIRYLYLCNLKNKKQMNKAEAQLKKQKFSPIMNNFN